MKNSATLELLSHSRLPNPVSPKLVACSPTISLTATVADEDTLFVRRSNGEQVSKHAERGQKVHAVRWKADGQFLAVGWSDGVVRLLGLENAKAVHHIQVSEVEDSSVTYIGWSRNLTGLRSPVPGERGAKSWRDLLSDRIDGQQRRELLDLPHELTFLEVDTSLPKISPLPVSGGSGDDMFVFSTRTSLEFVFQPLKQHDNDVVDVMLAGTSDARVHVSIYDTFVIGVFDLTLPGTLQAKGERIPLHLQCHAAHSAVSTYSLLLSQPGTDDHALYLVPMDLPFIYSSPVNLSLLASKTTTLQKLMRYIKQAQVHMAGEWQSTRELPGRFMMGIQEDLAKLPSGPNSIVEALYHTVVTGHTYPVVAEWLVDSLAERGHKRWDKAVISGLESLRDLVHQNMIPAIERCGVILSRLLGIARFHDGGVDLGFTSPQIHRLMDIVSCLALVSHRILLLVMEELELFAAFSSWLRFEIDKLATSNPSDELSEKEATMDNGKVLAYIQRYLISSPLGMYFNKVSKEDWTQDWEHIEDGPSLLDMLDKQHQKQETGAQHMKAFPQLNFLVNYLSTRANSVFQDIAEAERRSVRFSSPTRLNIGSPVGKYHIRMKAVPKTDGVDGITFTAITSESHIGAVYLFRTEIEIINGISRPLSTRVCCLSLQEGNISDIKFFSDELLLVLWTSQGKLARILAIPVEHRRIPYANYQDNTVIPAERLSNADIEGLFWSVEIPTDVGFFPMQMEVIGANKSRGDIPARLALLGANRTMYKVFALPAEVEMYLEEDEDVPMDRGAV